MPDSPAFALAASLADLAPGSLTQADVGGTAVLLARTAEGHVHACTAFCPHLGAPLAGGALVGTTVVCPWHHAAFDAASGALCEPPALDGLRTFAVRVEGGNVLVAVPPDADAAGNGAPYAASDGAPPEMAPRDDADERLVLVVGAGAGAEAAAEGLRADGYRGRIVLTTPEPVGPYDRTQLSKGFLAGEAETDALALRPPGFLDALGVELWTGRTAERLDADARTVTFADGETVRYDACLVATGGRPRRPDVPGADLPGVRTLRSAADALALRDAARSARRAVVVGASFIGMEAASGLVSQGVETVVVERGPAPMAHALGADVGGVFRQAAEEKGVSFRFSATVEAVARRGTDGGPDGLEVRLATGERLAADVVVIGVGVEPATDALAGHPARMDDGGLRTDRALRVAPGLVAAGDVAAVPDADGEPRRIEHWRLAQQHGRAAARTLRADLDGTDAPDFDGVPFFWTGQFGLSLRVVGHAAGWDRVEVDGALAERRFLARYLDADGRTLAVAAMGRDAEAAAIHGRWMRGERP